MALRLYDERELPKAFPEKGTDRNTTQMPKLIADGRVPINVPYVMRRRLNPELNDWIDNYFDTGDGIAYAADGRVKIVFDAQPLREISEKSELTGGALKLADGTYDSLPGIELSKKDVARYTGNELSLKNVKNNKLWRVFARNPDEVPKEFAQDARLLPEYAGRIFNAYREGFAKDQKVEDLKLMGVYLDSSSDVEKMRAAVVYWLEVRSQLDGRRILDVGSGRLVGVAPEALNASTGLIIAPTLKQTLQVVNQHLGRDLELRVK